MVESEKKLLTDIRNWLVRIFLLFVIVLIALGLDIVLLMIEIDVLRGGA